MDLDYIAWCLERLSPPQFLVYLICREIGIADIQLKAIATILDLSPECVSTHLKRLEKLKFIVRESMLGVGISLLWIRQNSSEKQPNPGQLKQQRLGIRLISPEGKIFKVKHGEIQRFCEIHQLERRSVYAIRQGKYSQHKGWRAA